MKINRIIIAVLIFIIIFGGVYLGKQLGYWQIRNSGGGKSSETEHTEETDIAQEESVYSEEEDHETEELISGSTTVQDVLDLGVTEEELTAIIGEYDNTSQLIKDVATANGLSFGKIKTELESLAE